TSGLIISFWPRFFFQAEDGIRDFHVTGVQTCALPILAAWLARGSASTHSRTRRGSVGNASCVEECRSGSPSARRLQASLLIAPRSEERRVGKERRSRG